MNRVPVAFSIALWALSISPAAAESQKSAEPYGQHFGSWGFDLTGMDRSVRPGDDFYHYANGAWEARTVLPPDRPGLTMWAVVYKRIHDRIYQLASRPDDPSSPDLMAIKAAYQSYMDVERLNALGAGPVASALADIQSAKDIDAVAKIFGTNHWTFSDSPLMAFIVQDPKRPGHNWVHLEQGEITLSRTDYSDPKSADKVKALRNYVAEQLRAVNWPTPDEAADHVVRLEAELATRQLPEEKMTVQSTFNPTAVTALQADVPAFPWRTFLRAAGLGDAQQINLAEPEAARAIAKLLADTPVSYLQAWLAFHLVDSSSPYLSSDFKSRHFDFHQRTLFGTSSEKKRADEVLETLQQLVPGALSREYAKAYFDKDGVARVEAIAADVKRALRQRISSNHWLTKETTIAALAKIDKMKIVIGYPASLETMSDGRVSDSDLYGNEIRALNQQWAQSLERLSQVGVEPPFEPYSLGTMSVARNNLVIVPAGMLQTPFFNPDADDAVNYGAIGAVLGHEMSHGFDSGGREYDENGAMRDWWQAADARTFKRRTEQLVGQYSKVAYRPGAFVNGRRTLAENIADLVGLQAAVDAYVASHPNGRSHRIDGFGGVQRVFLGFAQVWRAKFTDALLQNIGDTDEHAPFTARVNANVRNIGAWYDAFGVKPGDKLYLTPKDRIHIW